VDARSYQTKPSPSFAEQDRLREEWRLSAVDWVNAEDAASRAEDERKEFLDVLASTLVEQNIDRKMSQIAAERLAKKSDGYKSRKEAAHTLRYEANCAKIAMMNADRVYWQYVSAEATARAERRMG
jgi:hypothetical protein